LGSKVTLLDMNTQDEVTYTIVGSTETDPLAGRISNESPIGAALIDRKAGEVIEVTVPAGTIKLKVSKIQ
jgi:transcription elongation factor GreA